MVENEGEKALTTSHQPTSQPRRIRTSESVHIRLDKHLIRRLQDYAKATNRTLNNLCETLLYAAVEARERNAAVSNPNKMVNQR